MTRMRLVLLIIGLATILAASSAFAQQVDPEDADLFTVLEGDQGAAAETDATDGATEPAATAETPVAEAPAEEAPAADTAQAEQEQPPMPPEVPMVSEPAQDPAMDVDKPSERTPAAVDTDSPEAQFRWSDFVDTQLSFTYADDNVFENNEFSPSIGIGQRSTSEFTGNVGDLQPIQLQQTHLVLHHRGRGYLPGLINEAGLVLRFSVATDPTSGSPEFAVTDDGSFLTVGYVFNESRLGKAAAGQQDPGSTTSIGNEMILAITGFPFDSDRFLLGYHYNLTWGGETSFPQNRDPVPGVRISFSHPMFYAFAGFKTHLQPKKDKLNTERVPVETVYAGLFGVGVRPLPFDSGLLIESNGGIIQKGDNPTIPEVIGNGGRDDIMAWGVSGRVSYGMGMPISDRLDLRLYQNDPRKRFTLARRDRYTAGEFSFSVSGEFDYLSQNLADPENTGGTKAFNAPAALLAAKFKYDYLRVHVEGAYRSLAFLLFDTPGFIPFQAFPSTAETNPELYGVLAVDYYIKQAYLTVGLTGGFKRPASYRGSSNVPNMAVIKRRTTSSAYISPFNRPIEILPEGKQAFDIIEAKFNLQFDMSDFMTMLFELSYTLDNNRVKLATSPNDSETLIKVFEDDSVTNRMGVALVIQAMF